MSHTLKASLYYLCGIIAESTKSQLPFCLNLNNASNSKGPGKMRIGTKCSYRTACASQYLNQAGITKNVIPTKMMQAVMPRLLR